MKEIILKYLSENFGLEGDDAEDIFNSYVNTIKENIEKISNAGSDFTSLSSAAHSIKGCALNCGHTEMAETARSVEFAAKAADAAQTQELSKELFKIAEKLKSES